MKNTTIRLLVYAIFNGEVKFEDDNWCNVAVYNDEYLLEAIKKMTLFNTYDNKVYALSTLNNLSMNCFYFRYSSPGEYHVELYDNDAEDYLRFNLE